MIKTMLLLTLISLNHSYYLLITQKGIRGKGELTEMSKVLIDCYLKESDNKNLDKEESIILLSFTDHNKRHELVIHDDNKEEYADLDNNMYALYKDYLIIVIGSPDDIFFKIDVDKKQLKKDLDKEKRVNQKKYKQIEKGKYKGDIKIYSDYDPQVYYYISYSKNKIIKTTPDYLYNKICK
jgi:hypothetical protein